MKKIFFTLLFLGAFFCHGQDLTYTRNVLNTLTAPEFWGRGYTNNGMQKAAGFIEKEYKKLGLTPMDGQNFMQPFSFSVNTFPGKMHVTLNGKPLKPGVDFIVSPGAGTLKATAVLSEQDSTTFVNKAYKISASLKDKLTWSVAQTTDTNFKISLNRKTVTEKPAKIQIDVQNELVNSFAAANVAGMVKGTQYPDSLLIITAHYDHLGGMGSKTYFPGANDNASGVAFLLSLAKYYAANPQPYSIGFICFAAEEAGLVGSKYFTEHPMTDLKKVKFLLNLDLMGNGDAGITVVNATVFPEAFRLLNKINNETQLISKINPRGKAANSDHYWFTEKGVPAFFIYTQGGSPAYHDVFDTAANLPYSEYNDLFILIDKFLKRLK